MIFGHTIAVMATWDPLLVIPVHYSEWTMAASDTHAGNPMMQCYVLNKCVSHSYGK